MDIIYAPWRQKYVETCGKDKKCCVFCEALKKKDSESFIFVRTKHSFAVLNIYPFNGGHVLVLPNRHVGDLDELNTEERADLMDTIIYAKKLVSKALKPQAFNIGANTGHVAGAGIPEHLHFHIVPRWSGDVNFMSALFNTKVIPVSLKKIHKVLKNADKKRN